MAPRGVRWRDRRDALLLALAVILGASFVAGAVVGARQGGGHVIRGTNKADRLVGTPGDDVILGLRGRDRIRARPGNDRVDGGGGRDRITGKKGDDVLSGGPGKDRIRGGSGDDRLFADAGGALLIGGKGRDQFNMVDGEQVGGEGNDLIRARDGTLDEINCGPGDDTVIVDEAEDGVFDCEQVIYP
ncbi:MAG TPA: calcium-binding protein [Solirubrobacterales bacterium]|nr:calcium-binding protein [Solirubrobacterales bacterium]